MSTISSKLPYQSFPIFTFRRLLPYVVTLLVLGIVIYFVPSTQFSTDVNEAMRIKLTVVEAFFVAILCWQVIYCLPYALWIRKTGTALKSGPGGKSPLFVYQSELPRYNIDTSQAKWLLVGIPLFIASLITSVLVVMFLVRLAGLNT